MSTAQVDTGVDKQLRGNRKELESLSRLALGNRITIHNYAPIQQVDPSGKVLLFDFDLQKPT